MTIAVAWKKNRFKLRFQAFGLWDIGNVPEDSPSSPYFFRCSVLFQLILKHCRLVDNCLTFIYFILLLKIETARIDSLCGIHAHADKLKMVTRIENLNISTGRKILYGVMVTRIEILNISTGPENTLWRTNSQPLALRMAKNAHTSTTTSHVLAWNLKNLNFFSFYHKKITKNSEKYLPGL